MSVIGQLFRQLKNFVFRDRAARELEEEMRLHVQMRAERMQQLGQPPLHAGFAAQRRFGNNTVIQQRSFDMWGFVRTDALRNDVRFAVRRLRQRKLVSAAIIGALALGIGSATAMFSAVDAVLLRPLPFREPDRLASLTLVRPSRQQSANAAPPANHVLDASDVIQMHDIFSSVTVYAVGGLNLVDADRPVRLTAGVVSSTFFRTLGIEPVVGRAFSAEEGAPGGEDVAILSYGLWQRQFGGRDISTLKIALSSRLFQVIGVMPQRFAFPQQSDLWIPLSIPTTSTTYDAFDGFLPVATIARLAPGITEQGAKAKLLTRWEQSVAAMPRVPGRKYNFDGTLQSVRESGSLKPLQQELIGDRKTALYVLLGATACLLLIACANVMNLLLSQSVGRQRELAVRAVLGATRSRLVRQLLTECLILSTIGACIGIAFASLELSLVSMLLPKSLGGIVQATIDARVLLFAIALTVTTTLAFGLWPATIGTRAAPIDSVKSGGGHGATSSSSGRMRRVLVGAELALTLVLLVGAGLMARSFGKLMGVDVGFQAENVGTLQMTMPRNGDETLQLAQIDAMINRLSQTQGINSVGVVNDLPLTPSNGMSASVVIDGAPRKRGMKLSRYLNASGGYFNAMSIQLKSGRVFDQRDTKQSLPVAVISDTMAKAYWPGVNPLGRTFKFDETDSISFTVIGIVADVRVDEIGQTGGAQMYFSVYADTPRALAFVARSSLPHDVLLRRMVEAVHAVNPSQAVFNVRMMDQVIGTRVASRRTNTVLIGAFALVALVLAALGVYAVVAHNVVQRRREFGIRAALGATGANLVSLAAREMGVVMIVGICIGVAVAWSLARVVQSLMYAIDVHDPLTFAVVPFALLLPALIAILVPAWRASRVNPASVIKDD